jgi:transcriptional regulator with XRE-family HTH domain
MNLQQGASFRAHLQKEFDKRVKANPKYSLRAFAKFLGTDVSRLSKILRNQRPMSVELIEQFGTRLKLKPTLIEHYRAHAVSLKNARHLGRDETTDSLQITQDSFDVIADPIHYEILEAMKLKNFRPEVQWISQKIRAHPTQIDERRID